MHDNQGNLSEEEGFFAEKLEVRNAQAGQVRTASMLSKASFNRSPFEAKYLPWSGLLKKQPSQALSMPLKLHADNIQKIDRKRNKNVSLSHPYHLYAVNQLYQLVYTRSAVQPIVNDKYFMSNQIKLQHVGTAGLGFNSYKKLKDFDRNDHAERKPGLLSFDSRFESGNLHCAYRLERTNQYVLFVENDTNSLGYNQWFYFSVQHMEPNTKYTFRILLSKKKKHSFFKYGCRPAVFSLHEARVKGEGWSRRGKNIAYEQSPIFVSDLPNTKFYSLSFELTFDHKEDFCLISMGFPYSYTKLISFLREAQNVADSDPLGTLEFTIKSACRSICGNDVPQVTITRKSEDEKNKKLIIIMARQHPGEVWSSYMVEGMIRKLVSKPDEQMLWLLQNNIIKIFPMVNVDGVIYGNFRCDITGSDLNRRWKQTSSIFYPQVHEIKKLITAYKSQYKIQCCYDLHGHSKNYNVFAYSCKTNQYTCRILPLLISHINPAFYFPSCTFGISKYKESTARAAIHKITRNQNVLTIQTSFYGSRLNNIVQEFAISDIFKMGSDIVEATKHFLDKKGKHFNLAKKQVQTRITQFSTYDKLNEEDSGSESDPEGDQIDLQTKIQLIFNKSVLEKEGFVTRTDIVHFDQQKATKNKQKKIKIEEPLLEIKSKQYSKKNSPTKTSFNIKQKPLKKYSVNTIDQGAPSLKPYESTKVELAVSKGKKSLSNVEKKPKYQINEETDLKTQSPGLQYRPKKMSLNTVEPKSERKQPHINTIIRFKPKEQTEPPVLPKEAIEDQQLQKSLESVRKSNEFMKKFERFIPVSISIKNKANMTMFEQSLYNQDQGNLISTLIENKRKIELQKIRRNVQKSTYLVERQGKIKATGLKQKVVDFRAFKQNEKVNQQIRKLAYFDHLRHLE